ncbi:hypothetical protein ABNQ39_20555 [Azospirillum sp. A26]|uniref:hypothetical protein n=1 Tax=Azospirillum sp. A26 TaxID=3160607 RepID=UPI00366D2E28
MAGLVGGPPPLTDMRTKMLRITKEADGGVKIVETESGADLTKALMISYGATITLENYAQTTLQAQILMIEPDVIVSGAEWRTRHPVTGEIAAVEAIHFRDGTTVKFGEDGTPEIVPPPVSVAVVGSPVVQKFRGKSA